MLFNGTGNGHSWVSYSFTTVKLNCFNYTFSFNLSNTSIMHNDTTFLYFRNAVKQIEYVYGLKIISILKHMHSVKLMSQTKRAQHWHMSTYTFVFTHSRTWLATFVGKCVFMNEPSISTKDIQYVKIRYASYTCVI